MVTEYGMSSLGPVQYEQPQGSIFLGRDYLKEKNFSDQIALEIDKETRNIIENCYANAKQILLDNMDLLNNIANYLLQVETLTKPDIDEICATGHLKRADKADESDMVTDIPDDFFNTEAKDNNKSTETNDNETATSTDTLEPQENNNTNVVDNVTENARILVNGKVVKPSYQLKLDDLISIIYGTKTITVKVKSLEPSIKKEDASNMYEFISEVVNKEVL